MSFSKFAWIISYIIILAIPQNLVKAASSVVDLSNQHQNNNEDNPFCILESELNNSSLKNISNVSFSNSSSSPNLIENSFLNQDYRWLNFFQNFFQINNDSSSIASKKSNTIELIATALDKSSASFIKNNELIPDIQPFAYMSFDNNEPKFFAPQSFIPEQEYQIVVNDKAVFNIKEENAAKVISQRLEYFLSQSDFDPKEIYPTLVENKAGGKIGDNVLFVIDENIAHDDVINKHLLAVQWVNNLRIALDTEPLEIIEAQLEMYNLKETNEGFEGTASWYGPYFHGRLTANGEIYNQYDWTAAHPSLKLGTYLKIINLDNQKSMLLRINDRGPYIPPRTLDLSLGSAWCLDTIKKGVIPYKAVIMKPAN